MSFMLPAFQLSVFLSVFAIGLGTARGDLVSLFSRPGLLVRSLLATNVIMLIVAIVLVKLLHPPHLAAVAIIAMALAPMPPVMPKSMIKAGGEASYATALLAVAGLLALVWIPFALEWLEPVFGIDLNVSFAPLVKVVAVTVLAPLIAGAIVARLSSTLAARIQQPIAAVSGLLLAGVLLAILVGTWRGVASQLDFSTVLAIILFVLAGLLVGHAFGGPRDDDRTVLAMACAQRHPGIVIVLGKMAAPEEHGIAFVALLTLILGLLVTLPYTAWRKRAAAAHPSGGRTA